MATDNSELIMSLLSLLGVGNNQSKAWQTYGGINDKGPSTLIQQARSQITGITTSLLGPTFGPLVGGIAADYIAGQDFTRSGALHNKLSGLLSPSAGTYANAFQRTYQNQTLRMLTSSRQQVQKDLRQDFYKNYYDLTMEGVNPNGRYKTKKARDAAIQAQTKAAMNNMVSTPAALQFFMDPAQNKRAMQGIKNTQAGLLYWQSRMDPEAALGLTSGRQPQQMAKVLAQGYDIRTPQGKTQHVNGLRDMVKQANAWNLGKGKGGLQNSYGGFNGASVAELASILQNASNQLDISGMDGLKKSLNQFQKKVRDTSKALAPLKDIFGQDIKAMTDMIQATTGQNITQLTPSMINSIAKNTSDMARYSGATIAQIANAGQKLFMQSAQMGGTTFSRIGASQTGAFYSGLIAQGNAPAGVHAAQYAGNTQRAVASAQASAGADRAAMAYGLWRQEQLRNGKKDEALSVQTFMLEVQKNRRSTDTMMQALAKTVGPGMTEHGLIQGVLTSGYRQALQSGRMAQLGVSQQYQNKLGRAILGLRMSGMKEVSDQSLKQLGAFMSNQNYAADIKDLLTNANDPAAIQRFREKAKKAGYTAVTSKAINYLLNRGQVVQQGARWASISQINRFKASQQTLRKELAPLDAQGSGAYLSFWRALSSSPDKLTQLLKSDNENASLIVSGQKDGKSATISKRAVLLHTRALLGTTNVDETAKALKTIRTAFGDSQTANQVLALASGDLAKDEKYIRSLRQVAKGKTDTAEYANAKAYIVARRNKHISSKMSQQSFKDSEKDVQALYSEASKEYLTAMQLAAKDKNDDARKAAQEKAGDVYYKQIQKAYRLRNIDKLQLKDLDLDQNKKGQDAKSNLRALIKSGQLSRYAALSKDQFDKLTAQDKKAIGNLSLQQIRRAQRMTSNGYDKRQDFLREVRTVMTAIRDFLNRLVNQGVKVQK